MTKTIQSRRLLLLSAGVLSCYAVICGRLVNLQVIHADDYRQKAWKQQSLAELKPSLRGEIRDCLGNPLAASIPVKTICVDPALLTNYQAEVARVLSPRIGKTEQELIKTFTNLTHWVTNEDHKARLVTNRCVVLARNISGETWTNIHQTLRWNYRFECTNALVKKQKFLDATNSMKSSWLSFMPGRTRTTKARLSNNDKLPLRNAWLNALTAVDDQQRVYPNKELAAHVIGISARTEEEIDSRIIPQLVGAEGIEASFDDKLRGVCGWRIGWKDSNKHELAVYRELNVEPQQGLNVVLTINSYVQYIVQDELTKIIEKHSPQGASAIVVRPSTGEILALANLPTFDPGDVRTFSDARRRNRAIVDSAEPGSTFKIVTVSGALDAKKVTLDTKFDCEHGRFLWAGKILKDHEAYPVLSVEEIITKSSNIGTAKIAILMGQDLLYHYIRASGFGYRTGIPLGGESSGIVHGLDKWSKISISRIPMGQGVSATPLQMTMAMACVANKGIMTRPMLVSRLEDHKGYAVKKFQPMEMHRVISEDAARDTTKALKTVVTKTGTAAKASMECFTVAGKTGTAQKPYAAYKDKDGQWVKPEHIGYQEGKYFSSFIGFFPADEPEVCIGVFVDEPQVKTGYYGGQVAAPAFHHMAERIANYLNIRPDILPAPGATNSSMATASGSHSGSSRAAAGARKM